MSQSFALPFELPDTSNLPSPLIAREVTLPVSPWSAAFPQPVATSHSFTVPSSLAEASNLPSPLLRPPRTC